jgi:hypothetical protein
MPEKRDLTQTDFDGSGLRGENEGSGRPRWWRRMASGGSSRRAPILHEPALRRIRDLLGDYSEQTGAFF